jgi:hypothetical protein
MKPDELVLNQEQFDTLKEIYVERLVDNMSMKDLVIYVTNDIGEWLDKLTYGEAMQEFQEYWEDYFTDTIEEVLEIHPRHPDNIIEED